MPHMTRKNAASLVKLWIIGMLVQLFVIGYGLYVSYTDRVNLVNAQRHGCERAKQDRDVNAKGWRTAKRRSLSQGQPDFADIYDGIVTSLEIRSKVDCIKAFPQARLLP